MEKAPDLPGRTDGNSHPVENAPDLPGRAGLSHPVENAPGLPANAVISAAEYLRTHRVSRYEAFLARIAGLGATCAGLTEAPSTSVERPFNLQIQRLPQGWHADCNSTGGGLPMKKRWIVEGNEAAASVAYACSEVIARSWSHQPW